MNYGLRPNQIENIIREKINSDPNLKYNIEDDNIKELIDLLIKGIAIAIERNTNEAISRMKNSLIF